MHVFDAQAKRDLVLGEETLVDKDNHETFLAVIHKVCSPLRGDFYRICLNPLGFLAAIW